MKARAMIHHTIHQLPFKFAVQLPYTYQLSCYHVNGCFPLTTDPIKSKKAALIGMMVLRPVCTAWMGPWDTFDKVHDWCYGLSGHI